MVNSDDVEFAVALRNFLRVIGEDPYREGLDDTPHRYVKALRFWTSGYHQKPEDVVKLFEDGANGYDELVFQGSTPLFSLCEHHLSPFFGVAHVGYIPNGKVVGLSKIARLIDVFARRLQVQERLSTQIADALQEQLNPKAVGVVLRCRHTCISGRGVQKAGSITYTAALRGLFKTDMAARAEFMGFVDRADAQSQNQ